jgi:PAS domain S-box-containing protein
MFFVFLPQRELKRTKNLTSNPNKSPNKIMNSAYQLTHQSKTGQSKTTYEWRCKCGRLLFKGAFIAGIIEIKCPRCKRIVYLQEYNIFPSGRESFMAVFNPEGIITMFSKDLEAILGYQEGHLLGKNLSDILQPELSSFTKFWLDKIEDVGQTENPNVVGAIKLKKQQGEFVHIVFVAKHIMLEGQPMIFMIIEKGQNALARYTEQYVDSSTNSARQQREIWDFIVQKDGTITESSGPSFLGYAKDQLIGQPILEIFTKSKLNNPVKLKQSLALGQSFNLQSAELLQEDGSAKTLDIAFTLDVLVNENRNQYLVTFKNPRHK